MTSGADRPASDRERELDHVWLLFVVAWALAALFHLAGNPRLAPAWGRGLLGMAAVVALARPRDPRAVVPLAVAVLVNVWLEAPVLGSHFLLHGFVAVLVLAGVGVGRSSGGRVMARIGGPMRCTLLAFYFFAAFAKLNSDFFDPTVSCAVFYLEESVGSWGLGAMVEDLPTWTGRSLAITVALVELAIPVLLVARRTRHIGVVVALGFHYLLALDRTHQFFDFSSVLATLFLLFLAPETSQRIVSMASGLRDRFQDRWGAGPELARIGGLAGCALVVGVAAGPENWPAPTVLRQVGVAVWLVGGAVLIAVVVKALHAGRPTPARILRPGSPRILLIVPLLAVLNGLTPYLGLKSAAAWNMYSNLAVVGQESNHLLVRSGAPLTDVHERLVAVTDGGGGDLEFYVDSDWLLPERTLLDHVADQPGVVVQGTVDGRPVTYEGGRVPARPTWQQKFQGFRAVDAGGRVDCLTSFGPAR